MSSHVAAYCVPADERSADGHFPGNPIVPGAVLLREVVCLLTAQEDTTCCDIRAARFLHPVRPGDRLAIVWEAKGADEINFTCSTGSPERRVLVGTLRMRAR